MTKRKIATRISLILCIIVLFSVFSGSVPSHTTDFYVNDFADVLSEETKSHIMSTAVQLENETTAQVVVLTVESLDGKEISDFAVETFRSWGIGDKEKNNGVLILLSVNDREMWVTTGYGVEGTLTDARLGQLRDIYAIPYYSNDDFDTGTKLLFDAIVNELRIEEYGLVPLEGYESSGTQPDTDSDNISDGEFYLFLAFFSLPFVLVAALLLWLNYLKRYDRKHGTKRAKEFEKKYLREKDRYDGPHHTGGRGGRGGFGRGFGGGGFGGGGGFRGGGGSTGGGGAGGRF